MTNDPKDRSHLQLVKDPPLPTREDYRRQYQVRARRAMQLVNTLAPTVLLEGEAVLLLGATLRSLLLEGIPPTTEAGRLCTKLLVADKPLFGPAPDPSHVEAP